ncbi:unnamed protein product [Leptidea sinapis]|uniref:ODAD1 central coiled coil region domain-containing protein n=1 Tax=Leptidea sinapis TaxID=189913 RepID=A0A5E4Q873_9NEOP|nr:unnamed protein product [Leptidea sinapis]
MEISSPEPNDMEVLKKMEDEHYHLQRQVRMIQIDRQNRCMGVHPQFRRQDLLLRTLKKEYLNILLDLKIAKSGSNKKKDKKMKQLVKKRLLYHTKTKMECEEGIILMSQADELLQRKKKQLLKLKKILEERREQSIYRLSSTENKLEVAMRRFNTVHYENQKIRQEIEHMLNDRALFNESWTKMLVALKKGKKFLTDLFESSTVAYDQRDEWVSKLNNKSAF